MAVQVESALGYRDDIVSGDDSRSYCLMSCFTFYSYSQIFRMAVQYAALFNI